MRCPLLADVRACVTPMQRGRGSTRFFSRCRALRPRWQAAEMTDLVGLVRACRCSAAYKEGTCKVSIAISDLELCNCVKSCTDQLGFEWKQGVPFRFRYK